MLFEVSDKSILRRNRESLVNGRNFLCDGNNFGDYLQNNSAFNAFCLESGVVSTSNIAVIDVQEVESFASVVFRYRLCLTGTTESNNEVILYAKLYLPFLKGASNYVFRENPAKRGLREAAALSQLKALDVENLLLPPLLNYDPYLRLMLSFGIDQSELAVHLDPKIMTDGKLELGLGRILAEIHSRTFINKASVSMEHEVFADSLLDFRGSAARALATKDSRFRDLWDEFVEEARSNRMCLLHGDLTPRNVSYLRSNLILFDWEFSALGDPAFDIGFLLGHYVLDMILHPQSIIQVRYNLFQLWNSYIKNVSHPIVRNGLNEFEKRVVKYVGVTLFYRSWFKPSWRLAEEFRNAIFSRALSIFERESLMDALDQVSIA